MTTERTNLYSATPSALPFVSVFPENDVDSSAIERESLSRKFRQNRWLTASNQSSSERLPQALSPRTMSPESDVDTPVIEREKRHRKLRQNQRLPQSNQTTCEAKSTDKDADKARNLSKQQLAVPVTKDTQKAFVTRMSKAKQRVISNHVCYHHKQKSNHTASFQNRLGSHAKFLRKRQLIRSQSTRSAPTSPTDIHRNQLLEDSNSRFSYFMKYATTDRGCQLAQVCSFVLVDIQYGVQIVSVYTSSGDQLQGESVPALVF